MALFGDKKKEVKAKKEKTVRVHRARVTKLSDGVAHDIVRAPWFSEKALIMTGKGVYTFMVPKRATKAEIASAIKEIYKVEPRTVRVVNLPGKRKAMRTKRGVGQRPARRKAYVYLNTGDTIQFS
ncbi:MAG: 50S ribosomal protein L23 [Candidatus Paceibacterota bacterium]|jgi:large subunit ribosomal protein L23